MNAWISFNGVVNPLCNLFKEKGTLIQLIERSMAESCYEG